MSYSNDLKRRVIASVEEGESKTDVARRFQISRQTIYSWLLRYRSGLWRMIWSVVVDVFCPLVLLFSIRIMKSRGNDL